MFAKSVVIAVSAAILGAVSISAASAETISEQRVTRFDEFGNRITKTRIVRVDEFGNPSTAVRIVRADPFGNKVVKTIHRDAFGNPSAVRIVRADSFGNRMVKTIRNDPFGGRVVDTRFVSNRDF